jgi:Cu/Ag efflux pump CusA
MDIPLDNEKDVEQYWINLQASSQREKGMSDAKAIADATKSWVRIEGLQSTAGQALNGKVGQLITGKVNEEGRFAVKVDGEHSGKLLKGSNLVAVQKEELARTYLLPDHKTLFYPKITLCSLNVILMAIHQP